MSSLGVGQVSRHRVGVAGAIHAFRTGSGLIEAEGRGPAAPRDSPASPRPRSRRPVRSDRSWCRPRGSVLGLRLDDVPPPVCQHCWLNRGAGEEGSDLTLVPTGQAPPRGRSPGRYRRSGQRYPRVVRHRDMVGERRILLRRPRLRCHPRPDSTFDRLSGRAGQDRESTHERHLDQFVLIGPPIVDFTIHRSRPGAKNSVAHHLGPRLELAVAFATSDPVAPELGAQDLSGNSLSRAPEWKYSLGLECGPAHE